MAYYLSLNALEGDQQYLTLQEPFDLFTPTTYYVEIDIQVFEVTRILTDGVNINTLEIGVDSLARTTRLKRSGSSAFWYHRGVPDTEDFHTFGFEKLNADTYELFINGVSLGTRTNADVDDNPVLFDTIAKAYRSYERINLKSLKLFDARGGTLLRHYDPSASVGLGYLAETVSGYHATPQGISNFETSLVYYDDGGGTATLDANVTLPSLTATGNASATLPQPTLSASVNLTQLSATGSASATLPTPQLSAAITLPSLTATGNAAATLPNPTLQASITMPIITASGNISASLPQPTLSASITLPTITVSGSASATLPGFNLSGNITLPVITATGAAQATLPQPILTATVNLPTLTATGSATATEPSFTLSGNVTLPTITVTGAASATLPQPTLSGNITLPSIQVSGFLVGGEIVITIDASTNINEPTLSTNITEPTLSTNISE